MSFVAVGSAVAGAVGATGIGATLITGAVSGLGTKLVGDALGGLIGGRQQMQMQAPAVAAPTTMPLPDDKAAALAKKSSIAEQLARRGRASTILTDTGSDKLGG
jgi:hypothetical protein